MSQPTNSNVKFLKRVTAAGAAVTGKVTGDFTFNGFHNPAGGAPATYAHGSVITEIGLGYYAWTYVLPSTVGWTGVDCAAASGTDLVYQVGVGGELESNDLDSLFSSVSRPAGSLTSGSLLGDPVAIQLVPYRYRTMVIPILDENDVGVDLTAYNNFAIGVRSHDQVTTKWDAINGSPTGFVLTGDASGNLSITWPESVIGPEYLTWVASTVRTLGDFVVPTALNGYIYECTTAGTSAGGEPVWPTTVGSTIADGTATWTCRNRTIWTASTAKTVGLVVTPTTRNGYVYRCTTAGTTGGSAPTFPVVAGQTVTDGTVVWECMSDFYAALLVGVDTAPLYYEVIADLLATNKTKVIIPSSSLTLSRRERGV